MNVMRAIRIHRRGGPEALVYEGVPIPALQRLWTSTEVLRQHLGEFMSRRTS